MADRSARPNPSVRSRLSRREFLRTGAYQLHRERRSGVLKPGRWADLVVLDRNLFRVPLTDVSTTQVEMTMIGGEAVYRTDAV